MYITNNYFPENDVVPVSAKIRAYNLNSPRTNEPVKNQFAIRYGYNYINFQSYDTTCIKYDFNCKVATIFPEAFNYSRTTSKYSKVFLMDEIGLTENQIDELKKIVKKSDFGRDCPLYIQF